MISDCKNLQISTYSLCETIKGTIKKQKSKIKGQTLPRKKLKKHTAKIHNMKSID